MQSEIKKLNATKFEISVVVPREELKEKEGEVLRHLNAELTVPGFRKGKAPQDLFLARYRSQFEEELIKKCVPVYCEESLKAQDLEVIDYPLIKDIHLDKVSLRFTAEIETKPQFKLEADAYKHLRIKIPEDELKEPEVDKAIENLQAHISELLPVKLSDDESARFSGYPDAPKLREAIKSELFIEKLKRNRANIEDQVLNELLKKVAFPVPESVLKKQVERLTSQETMHLQMRGITDEEIQKNQEDIRKKAVPLADKQLKIYYIMEKIIALEGIAKDKVKDVYNLGMGIVLRYADWGK